MKEFSVSKNDAGQRLDRFADKAVPLLPSSLLQKYIRLKRIKVNGKGSSRDLRLTAGDIVQMYINDEFFDAPSEENAYLKISSPKLNVIYEDANILLLDKAPGILCHSAGKWDYSTLISNVQAYLFQKGEWNPKAENSFAPALCNRIDRNTGGIVIAAKNAPSLRVINEKIKAREIEKFYLCIVSGRPAPAEGVLSGYIFKDAAKNRVYVREHPEKGAKEAATRYRTIAVKGGLSLIECELLTGRTHQIRAQFSAAGWPLLGDGKYGREADNKPFGETKQALYSYRVRFSFKTDAAHLDYLTGREYAVGAVPFAEKYFGRTAIPKKPVSKG